MPGVTSRDIGASCTELSGSSNHKLVTRLSHLPVDYKARIRLLLGIALSLLSFLLVGSGVGVANSTGTGASGQSSAMTPVGCNWSILPSPNAEMYNRLNAVVPITANDVWAIGSRGLSFTGQLTLIEHWDGTQWSIVPSPNPGELANELLDAVAISANDIWAVGYYHSGGTSSSTATLVLHWDGTSWTQVDSPNVGTIRNDLSSIAAVSANDIWAVGYSWGGSPSRRTLAMRWNGVEWSIVETPVVGTLDNELSSVTALAEDDVWAVGQYMASDGIRQTLIEHWDGTKWSVVPSPSVVSVNNYLNGIDGTSSDDIWAVGYTCPGNCFGVNIEQALALHWDGVTWSITPLPLAATSVHFLNEVVALSASDAWAVGAVRTETDASTLAMHWDGSAWSIVPTANPDSSGPEFNDVATLSDGAIWAVGHYHYAGNPVFRTLTERYSGDCSTPTPTPTSTSMTPTMVQPTTTPVQSSPTLTGTSTPGPTGTTAVSSPTASVAIPTVTGTSTVGIPSATPTSIATATTTCAITFTDVPANHTFYANIRCLACRGIISGYSDGTFRPGNEITRSQIAKMVSNAAGLDNDPGAQIFEDVDQSNPFYAWINRLSQPGYMGGYPCGTVPEEPCNPPENRPYFRPFANATRGQLAKIVANAAGITGEPTGLFYTDVQEDHPFYTWIMRLTNLSVMSGYPCGGANEPCDEENRPYFRPVNNVTRGQASKIVANTFYPNCQTPQK